MDSHPLALGMEDLLGHHSQATPANHDRLISKFNLSLDFGLTVVLTLCNYI